MQFVLCKLDLVIENVQMLLSDISTFSGICLLYRKFPCIVISRIVICDD